MATSAATSLTNTALNVGAINVTRVAVTAIVSCNITIQTYIWVVMGKITAITAEVQAFMVMALLVQLTIGWFVEKVTMSGIQAQTATPRELAPPSSNQANAPPGA